MLFAIKYQPRPGRTEAESKRVRELLMKWEAPAKVQVDSHYHFISGGGVLIVKTEDPSALYETLEPFKTFVDFDLEPVINFLEAISVSADVDEWVASVSAASYD